MLLHTRRSPARRRRAGKPAVLAMARVLLRGAA
jgi:hypothetical protein